MPKSEDKVGALWVKEQRGGGEYFSGEIEIGGRKQRVVVFKNGYRTDVNRQPHYIIYRDQPPPAVPDTRYGSD